jgi:hypothetical protein
MANAYELDLDKNPANYQPLTPLTFLERAATVHPDRLADAATTSGTPSRSTTPRAPPAIPRASSITTAAPTCAGQGNVLTCEHGPGTPSTCGRCRCSTATAGASPGRWPRTAGVSVCLRQVRARHVGGDRRARRDAHVRRADRHGDAAVRARGGMHGAGAPPGQVDDRRRPAARGGARRHGRARLRGHPRLRPDRDLRPPVATNGNRALGRPAAGRARHAEGAPGRARPRWTDSMVLDPETMAPVPMDGETWARSSCAAMSS